MRDRTVKANGIEFAYLEEGDGPLVLLLHGFPDDARTWSTQMPALAGAGYRAVAPFLRGYPPTEVPPNGCYDAATLTADVKGLIDALGDGPAFLIGHDWGAMATYNVAAAFPEAVRRAVAMAVPHPAAMAGLATDVAQIQRSFYIFFFQLPNLAEVAVPANDFAFIEHLWRHWSPGLDDPEQLANVKETLGRPGAVEAAVGYYRALFDPGRWDPALADVRAAAARPIAVPTLYLQGADDGCLDPAYARAADAMFTGEYRIEVLPGCGHFLHRERVDEVNRLVLDWLGKG